MNYRLLATLVVNSVPARFSVLVTPNEQDVIKLRSCCFGYFIQIIFYGLANSRSLQKFEKLEKKMVDNLEEKGAKHC